MSDVKFSQNGGGDETKVTFISGNQKSISEQDKGKSQNFIFYTWKGYYLQMTRLYDNTSDALLYNLTRVNID